MDRRQIKRCERVRLWEETDEVEWRVTGMGERKTGGYWKLAKEEEFLNIRREGGEEEMRETIIRESRKDRELIDWNEDKGRKRIYDPQDPHPEMQCDESEVTITGNFEFQKTEKQLLRKNQDVLRKVRNRTGNKEIIEEEVEGNKGH